ncbi:dioxygenase [Sphingopyxis sp. DBS4]|uniref:dioxygenase n=1 Tax=Sphingopyxis sp. DBS4 TaxID=2968500 RepID=UPI00214D02FD|nr:dioxygenase [Sphingopyxis sp. DBS4]
MGNRVKEITMDIVNAIREQLIKHDVTFDEYRAGFAHMIETQKSGEIPLLLDVFLNSTIVEIENKGSVAKIVKLEHAWRRLDGRNDDGFQVAPFPG